MDDAELLQRYVESHSETAFAEVVRRHVDLVYSAALRQVGGNPHHAEEVTQMVFLSLARKASSLKRHPLLLAWLHQSARFAASNLRREEHRRRSYELLAAADPATGGSPQEQREWTDVRPVLDDAVNALSRIDRDAVLLRFFANRPFAEVGRQLGLTENSARMRVERALGKLQSRLARRGITSTAAALAAALSANAVTAAPVGMAASATGAALAGVGTSGAGLVVLHLLSSIKLPAVIAGVLLAGGATAIVMQQRSDASLRREIAAFGRENGFGSTAAGLDLITSLRGENQQLARARAAAAGLQETDGEIARLRAEAQSLAAKRSASAASRTFGEAIASTPQRPAVYDPAQLDQQPLAIQQPGPHYPAALKKAGTEGQTLIEFTIRADGNVADPRAVSATDPAFSEAAIAAVQQWKFQPGQLAGQAVGTREQVPIMFTIVNDGGNWF